MENKTTIPLKKHVPFLNGLVIMARLLVGLTFVFSGFVKAVDPLGSSYKFADYLVVLGLDFLLPTTLFAAVVLAALEFWLSIINYRPSDQAEHFLAQSLHAVYGSFYTLDLN